LSSPRLSGRTVRGRRFALLERKVFRIGHRTKPANWYKDKRAILAKDVTDVALR
jgi:hypothetical protein